MTERGSREEIFLTAKQVAKRYGMSRTWAYHCPELQSIRRKIGKENYPLGAQRHCGIASAYEEEA